jgi:uncharacterized membrane protein YbaN (DUF454 family)
MRRILHKTTLHIIGYIAIFIGLAGLILPIIPGLVFIAIGVFFFTRASKRFNSRIDDLKLQYPRVGYHYDIFDSKVTRFVKRAY